MIRVILPSPLQALAKTAPELHLALEAPLPEAVTSGREPYLIVGAMSGG